MTNQSRKESKTLSFKLSLEEYADFWLVAGLLNESTKKATFLKMLKIVKSIDREKLKYGL